MFMHTQQARSHKRFLITFQDTNCRHEHNSSHSPGNKDSDGFFNPFSHRSQKKLTRIFVVFQHFFKVKTRPIKAPGPIRSESDRALKNAPGLRPSEPGTCRQSGSTKPRLVSRFSGVIFFFFGRNGVPTQELTIYIRFFFCKNKKSQKIS